MKTKMTYIIATLIFLFIVWTVAQLIMNKVDEGSNLSYEPFRKQNNELFLSDIDLSSGNFLLYIKHKEFGEFAITDTDILKKNKDTLKVNISWVNYLPGEGNRSYGIKLFKDGKLIKQKSGGVFKVFDIGNLKQKAVAVKKYRFSGVKREIENKIDSLKANNKAYITFQSDLPKEDKEFHFRVYFPSIAVPVTREKDNIGYEKIKTINGIDYNEWLKGNDNGFNKKWESKIEKCIRTKAGDITNFDVSISYGTLSDGYIFNINEKWSELKNTNNQLLYVKDFMYYQYEVYISANKEDAKKLRTIDYSTCINDIERNRPIVITKIKNLVKQSTKPHLSVENGEVGLLDYRDSVTKSEKLYEQEYQLNWLEIE